MPGPINRVPQGLLSLLDMKAQGENPRELSYILTGVLEMLDFYLAPKREAVSQQSAPVIGPQSNANLTPAAGELWVVRQVSAFSNADIPAAATLEIKVGFVPVAGAQFIGLGDLSGTKATGQRALSSYADPFVLQPGDQLGFFSTVLTGAPGNVRISALISRLTI